MRNRMSKYLVLKPMEVELPLGKISSPKGETIFIAYDSLEKAQAMANGAQILKLENEGK